MISDPSEHETPQAFMERLVYRYELGQILQRRQSISSEVAIAHQQLVRLGEARSLYEALQSSGAVAADVLQAAFVEGYHEVSSAFLALKLKLVSKEKLRTLLNQAEQEERSLLEVMHEHGIYPPDPGSGGPGPRTPAPIMPRPSLPGSEVQDEVG